MLANKIDLEEQRVVSEEEGRNLADSWNVPFMEISCKLRINIDEAIAALLRTMYLESNDVKLVTLGDGGVGKR